MAILENKFAGMLLCPFSFFYGAVMSLRNFFYDAGIYKIHRLQRTKVISIGNISVGGTGKTPFTIFLAHELSEKNLKVAILSRGYKRKSSGTVIVSDGKKILTDSESAGDEPFLIARNLPGVPVVCESDRYKGGLLIEKKFAPDVILLDDAFQHRRLFRDIDIVLFDATRFRQSQRTLPAGYLREPISGLKRADLICVSRVDQAGDVDEIIENLINYSPSPIITGSHRPQLLIHAKTGKAIQFDKLKGKHVALFSGIGNPESFGKTIASLGMIISDHLVFKDHHDFSEHDLAKILNLSKQSTAEIIIATEKDIIRLQPFQKSFPENLYYLQIGFEILQGKEALFRTIANLQRV